MQTITPSLQQLPALVAAMQPDRVFLLADERTARLCVPRLPQLEATSIVIAEGDTEKTLASLQHVWTQLVEGGATRHSLLINVGGGMITDLGGFAAATFKRGIRFINVPTTLLAMVDAAVGGKTGVNFCGLKNEIGAFRLADAVIIDTLFLSTLDAVNLRSGYAEMLKHSMLCGEEMLTSHLAFPLNTPDLATLQDLVAASIEVKQRIVEQDPYEQGLRRALNLGHTAGHAFESLLMQKGAPVLHGVAVAWGLSVAMFLSVALEGFPESTMRRIVRFIREHYGALPFTCDDYSDLLALIRHDKKNSHGHTAFTLLKGTAGFQDIVTGVPIEDALIKEAFDFVREL